MDEYIQLIANISDWKSVKKLTITEKVMPIDITDFLASVAISFESNIDKNIGKLVDLKAIDTHINSIVKEKVKKEEDFAQILKELASPKTSKVINDSINAELEKDVKEKLKIYLKIYVNRKALSNAGLIIDYTKVPIPINKGKI